MMDCQRRAHHPAKDIGQKTVLAHSESLGAGRRTY
jgi:hypothetical protein